MATEIKPKIDWSGPIQVAIVAGIILGANLPFYMMHRNDLRAIEHEIKDFHTRLLKIEEARK